MFKRFCKYYKPHKKLFFLVLFCVLLMGCIDLIFPAVTRYILKGSIDSVNYLITLGVILLFLYLLRFVMSYIIAFFGHVLGIRIESDMRRDLFSHFQSLDYQFFDDKKSGELQANLTSHLHDVSEASHHVPEDLLVSILMIVGSFIILMFINVPLTLICFVSIAILTIFAILRRKKLMASFRAVRKEQGELLSKINSSIGGIYLTKAYNNEKYELEKFAIINEDYKIARSKSFKELGLFHSTVNLLTNITNLILLIVGSLMVINSAKTNFFIEDLVAFFLYINFLISPINRLSNTMEMLQQGWSGVEKFMAVMDIDPSIVSPKNAITKNGFLGNIEFKDVSFSYKKDHDLLVLKNFNLKIEAGQKIAIVGETGVGKSTISKIIPRFYDVDSGKVLIDGQNVKDYDLFNLRKQIGHVQQDIYIFFGSIKENIAFGNPEASFKEIQEAAKKANIHDFIMSLPNKYETYCGERGVQLSGGQKQRISIARIFLKNPSILILDEATSSLDNITEKLIQSALDELAKNRTTIVIAHRLSTIKNADKIIVLGKDGILEEGNHQELMKHKEFYYNMYNSSIEH